MWVSQWCGGAGSEVQVVSVAGRGLAVLRAWRTVKQRMSDRHKDDFRRKTHLDQPPVAQERSQLDHSKRDEQRDNQNNLDSVIPPTQAVRPRFRELLLELVVQLRAEFLRVSGRRR